MDPTQPKTKNFLPDPIRPMDGPDPFRTLLSVVDFNSAISWAYFFITSYFGFRFTNAYN